MQKGLKPEFQRKAVYNELLSKVFELGVQMDHPNIAQTFSFETDPVAGRCIVTEYVDGCMLKEFLAQSPSRAVRRKIAKEILSAMSYFHGKQIIHRDLKHDIPTLSCKSRQWSGNLDLGAAFWRWKASPAISAHHSASIVLLNPSP